LFEYLLYLKYLKHAPFNLILSCAQGVPRARSPTRAAGAVSAIGSGYSLMSLAKGAAGNVSEKSYPSGCYNKGEDVARCKALNVLFQV